MKDDKNLGESIWQGIWLTLPIYPWFSSTTKQTYMRNIFEEMRKKNITFRELRDIINKWVVFRNEAFGRHYDNTEVYFLRENTRFGFFLHENCPEFSLYNDNSDFLGSFAIEIDKAPTEEFVKWIEEITYEYINDLVHCSDCRKLIKKSEIAGNYYAGIYCKDCWEKEWKEREANENYE